MKLSATGNTLELNSFDRMTSESVGIYTTEFEFDSLWDGFAPTAVFKTPFDICSVAIGGDGKCTVPWEALKTPGPLSIAVFGVSGKGAVITTNYITPGLIIKGADISANSALLPQPSVYAQILETLGGLLNQLEVI